MKNKTNVKTVQTGHVETGHVETGHVETGHALSVPQQKLIPKLRFPEFVNSGEWEVKRVNEYFDVCSSKRVLQKDWKNKGVPFYRTRELVSLSKNEAFRSEIYISKNLFYKLSNKYGIPKIGDFLVSGVGTLGVLFQIKNNEEFYFKDGNVLWFKIGREIVSDFFKYSFQTAFFQKQIFSQSSASTVGTYTITNARETKFWKPSDKQEQQKIASCLSSLDEVIETHSKKLQLLKDHKKGLMQNLFPQEGEKVPKLRFPEFQNCGEWEETKLGEVCKLVRGPFGGALKKEIFVKKGYAIYEQSHAIYGDFSSFRYYIDEDKFTELKRFSVKSDDLIMSCSGTMGKFAIIPNNYSKGVINQALLKLTVKKGFDVIFTKMTLEAENNQNKLLSQSAGGAIKNVVSVSQIRELDLLIPSLKEQQKIASCLSALDDLITVQEEKIEQLQEHKKGLMQGLFPVQTGHALSQQ